MGEQIKLTNPEAERFGVFIFANSLKVERVVEADTGKGRTVIICGAGPSLRAHMADYCHNGDDRDVWGVNSALIYLTEQGQHVTHGFTVDQTLPMLEEWAAAPDVEYLLASSVHPNLTDMLHAKGRRTWFFHNFCGVKPVGLEPWMYQNLYDATVMVGSGLNSVNRAICLAEFMGFERIVVLGADCALGPNDEMHADGGGPTASGATRLIIEATIDGRLWRTKVDMAVSAVDLVRRKKELGDRLELIGDTLPNAIMDKPDDFLAQMPSIKPFEEQEAEAAKVAETADRPNIAVGETA